MYFVFFLFWGLPDSLLWLCLLVVGFSHFSILFLLLLCAVMYSNGDGQSISSKLACNYESFCRKLYRTVHLSSGNLCLIFCRKIYRGVHNHQWTSVLYFVGNYIEGCIYLQWTSALHYVGDYKWGSLIFLCLMLVILLRALCRQSSKKWLAWFTLLRNIVCKFMFIIQLIKILVCSIVCV